MAKKKGHEEEHENHERWLVSYADFITLLFAFFVVMYSVSRVDNKRLSQVVSGIKFAMHFKGTGGVGQLPLFEGPASEAGCVVNVGADGPPSTAEKQMIETVRRRLDKRLRSVVQNRMEQNAVAIVVEGRRLTVRLSAARFFDASQAAIRPEMIPVLDAIASELVPLRRVVRIEGHTDDHPTASGTRFRDNWDLSSSRAAAVASYVQRAHRADGKLLAATGHGSSRPIAPNATVAGREANRRIEMVVELNTVDALDAVGR